MILFYYYFCQVLKERKNIHAWIFFLNLHKTTKKDLIGCDKNFNVVLKVFFEIVLSRTDS